MDIIQFFGRFHVLVLHLPIGILMLAALMEIYSNIKKLTRNALLDWVWFWGAISAVAACVLGWMLSQGDGYTAEAIFIHRTFGISVAVIAFICWWFFKHKSNWVSVGNVLASAQLFLLFSTGHYGANMTHGETYLVDKAPNFVRIAVGFEPHAEPRPPITSLKDAYIYEDVIAPMLEKRCSSCHNDAKQKGKLNLANIEGILKGGRGGDAVVANDLDNSLLYQRITLPHGHKEFMPAEGKTPLTDEQVKAFAWWINSGLPTQGIVTEHQITKQDKKILQDVLGLTPSEFDLPPIPAITTEQYNVITQAGFVVKQITQGMNYLDIDYSSSVEPISDEKFALLTPIKHHIVYLNLRRAELNDELTQQIVQFSNLKRLRLEKNPIGDASITLLSKLHSLKYLNLYATDITEASLNTLKQFSALERVFVGETNIAQSAIVEFNQSSNIKLQAVIVNNSSDKAITTARTSANDKEATL